MRKCFLEIFRKMPTWLYWCNKCRRSRCKSRFARWLPRRKGWWERWWRKRTVRCRRSKSDSQRFQKRSWLEIMKWLLSLLGRVNMRKVLLYEWLILMLLTKLEAVNHSLIIPILFWIKNALESLVAQCSPCQKAFRTRVYFECRLLLFGARLWHLIYSWAQVMAVWTGEEWLFIWKLFDFSGWRT